MTTTTKDLREEFMTANVAVEAFHDDVMEIDHQKFDISVDVTDCTTCNIRWSWR